jgi:hypothetical protein
MLGCQIPAFGVWNYCSDLPITQYFDLAMQARLLKRGNRRRCCSGEEDQVRGGGGERRLVLFNTLSPSPRKPAQIKVRVQRSERATARSSCFCDFVLYLQDCNLLCSIYFCSSL